MGVSPRRSGRSTAAAAAAAAAAANNNNNNTSTSSSSSSHHHNPSPPSPRKRRNSLQSYNQSPPPTVQHQQQHEQEQEQEQPSLSSPPPDDEEEEEEEDDGSAEITRCVCGSQEYPFPDADIEDAGFMICCERCNVWQHGPCVGVMSENEAPDIYFCEECRPDLHELGARNQGWIGSSIPQQPPRRKKSTAQTTSLKGESLSPPPSESNRERKPSPKKRSTMNSRDAAYDYASLFPHSNMDEDTKMEDGVSPPASLRSGDRSRRRGKRVADDDDEDLRSRSSKRRRESNETEEQQGDNIDAPSSRNSYNNNKSRKSNSNGRRTKDADSDMLENPGKDDSSSDHQHQGSATPLLDIPTSNNNNNRNNNKRSNGSKRSKSSKPDRIVDSEEPPTPTFRREEPSRQARARVPQARSGLNEMRKRVGAILEYVGRLQTEAVPTESVTPTPSMIYFCRANVVDDTTDIIEKPDLDNAPSMVIMQYLTKRCLDFEVKFGKYPGRYG